MSAIDESDELHAAVRAFAAGETADSFEALAVRIARFQAARVPGFARLVELGGRALERLEDIPAVPADAFRLTRVAVHPPELDVARFVTSGTTGAESGVHPLRTLRTYEELALRIGRASLLGGAARATVVALAPAPGTPPSSSLAFMMSSFVAHFDGRGLDGGALAPTGSEHWLVQDGAVNVAGLARAADVAGSRSEPLLVLATSFALAALLTTLEARLALPAGSVVMQTGGFKGRTREIAPEFLRERTAAAFGIELASVVSEYGMTELTSQLYNRAEARGLYVPPPWLRVDAVNPVSLTPCADGLPGLARFVDLGNVDSAVCVVTRDRVRRRGDGVELLGREGGAPPRGCSLALEALLEPNVERSARRAAAADDAGGRRGS